MQSSAFHSNCSKVSTAYAAKAKNNGKIDMYRRCTLIANEHTQLAIFAALKEKSTRPSKVAIENYIMHRSSLRRLDPMYKW